MGHIAKAKHLLKRLDRSGIFPAKRFIDVSDYSLHVSRAVSRHIQADGLKVFPKVTESYWINLSSKANL